MELYYRAVQFYLDEQCASQQTLSTCTFVGLCNFFRPLQLNSLLSTITPKATQMA